MKTGAKTPACMESGLPSHQSFQKVTPRELLSSEDQSKLEDLIMGEVMLAHEKQGLTLPFLGIRFRPSIVVIECTTEQSAEWLISMIPNLKGWEGVKLRACSEEHIPRARTITTYFPRSTETKEEDILKIIKAQNTGINTILWRVLNTKVEGKGKLLPLSIDESSCEEIERRGHTIFFWYGRIPIHGLRKRVAREGEGMQSIPCL